MQSCASAAKLRGGGPNLRYGLEARSDNGSPPPRIVLGDWDVFYRQNANLRCPISSFVCYAGRSATPTGTSPVVTKRQSEMSSLRANATTIVLRVPRAFSVRARYHCARALSFWNMRKRHASWIMPRRTRAFPVRASPFCRRLLPLSSGEPVRPAYRATAFRSRKFSRQNLMHEHVRGLHTDTDYAGQQADHCIWPFHGRML